LGFPNFCKVSQPSCCQTMIIWSWAGSFVHDQN
jgi:hypothetical protein